MNDSFYSNFASLIDTDGSIYISLIRGKTYRTKGGQMIKAEITDKAVKEIKKIIEEQGYENHPFLRVRCVGGGCSGIQTKLDIDEDFNEEKDVKAEINSISIVIDKRSLLYLSDVKIDFIEDINHRGFSVDSAAMVKKCGCGSSFSV